VDEDAFNLSVRKFLKQLGITAQRDIELGVRELIEEGRLEGDEQLAARATVVVEGLDQEIVIEGEIALSGKTQPG
jgi:16S rRNA U516 pseudouridylate synthase RsuA-like enzyme